MTNFNTNHIEFKEFKYKIKILISLLFVFSPFLLSAQTLWIDELDFTGVQTGWNRVHNRETIYGDTLSVNGLKYKRGICLHAICEIELKLDGKAQRFLAKVGVDDVVSKIHGGSVDFKVYGDQKLLFDSGVMSSNQPAKSIDLDISGIRSLVLFTDDAGNGTNHDYADWLDARIEYSGDKPSLSLCQTETPYILTPKVAKSPNINGPSVVGCTPGHEFNYRIPVSGERPVIVEINGLPLGVTYDNENQVISGKFEKAGEYTLGIKARNKYGSVQRKIYVKVGNLLALTPPMGWNSWNLCGTSVDENRIRSVADALISSGLADFGWTYVNIDDGWQDKTRNSDGTLGFNQKFKDMKALADDLHKKGLKLGIYSSPGPLTCGNFQGSYKHEDIDAKTWASWGIDYLKYDWCSYQDFMNDKSLLEDYQRPYSVMRDALVKTDRDIVFSLCQYGKQNVWRWGAKVGGNSWRTTGDIIDTWHSVRSIGFAQDTLYAYAKPGHWNDPDMMVVGTLGWGNDLHQTRLTPTEQYTHITLWSLLSAPLLLGCDLSKLDEFTLNLLTNSEVIAINQDALGKQAYPVLKSDWVQIWVKDLENGDKAVGLFNLGNDTKVVQLDFSLLGHKMNYNVRDVWRNKSLGKFRNHFQVTLQRHGSILLKLK